MKILYQDSKLVVVIKPQGVLSTDEPGGLPELLRSELGETTPFYTVHRLDRVVGGVMVLARTRHAASTLGQQIQNGEMHKQYLAAVYGSLPEESEELRDWLLRDRKTHLTSVVSADTPGAQEALLEYRRLARTDQHSLLRIRLHTGRTHQIRVQLASRGCPIVGDRRYGRDEDVPTALWSCSLAFSHPASGAPMEFFELPPAEGVWKELLQEGESSFGQNDNALLS